jgi:hypothetical protein
VEEPALGLEREVHDAEVESLALPDTPGWCPGGVQVGTAGSFLPGIFWTANARGPGPMPSGVVPYILQGVQCACSTHVDRSLGQHTTVTLPSLATQAYPKPAASTAAGKRPSNEAIARASPRRRWSSAVAMAGSGGEGGGGEVGVGVARAAVAGAAVARAAVAAVARADVVVGGGGEHGSGQGGGGEGEGGGRGDGEDGAWCPSSQTQLLLLPLPPLPQTIVAAGLWST